MNESLAITPERGRSLSRWHSKPVEVLRGEWDELRRHLPSFTLQDFVAVGHEEPNPYYSAVVRNPVHNDDTSVPIAIVGHRYGLVQHRTAGDAVVEAMKKLNVWFERMECRLELTELGEWMHVRFTLDESFSIRPPDGNPVHFCVDLYNSVDGQSRLLLQTSWLRLVCDNGLILSGATGIGLTDIHDCFVKLGPVDDVLATALKAAEKDARILEEWWASVLRADLRSWADTHLMALWGKFNAARVLALCESGMDGEPARFVSASPSELPLQERYPVPGARSKAETCYDVAQALSWVAGRTKDVVRREKLLADIPALIDELRSEGVGLEPRASVPAI